MPHFFRHALALARIALRLALGLLICLAPVAALAGQTIIIDSNVTGSVHGNSTLPDYSDYAGDPNNNTVIINSGGKVSGSVFGSYAAGAGNVTGNSVFITGGEVSGSVVAGGYIT